VGTTQQGKRSLTRH
jgi:SAM-dependent methyltransferase